MLTCLILATMLHGGQYLPPLVDPDDEPEPRLIQQPGTGPTFEFQAGRWEWWFDFHQEVLLDLRRRMAQQQAGPGQPTFEPVTDRDRAKRILPLLVDNLRVRQRNVRGAAAMALGHLAIPDVVPYLELVLEDDDLFVRTHAIIALGISGQPAATEALSEILRDSDRGGEQRTFAAAALGLVGTPEAVDVLRAFVGEKALADEKNMLRAGLVYAAGVSGDPQLGDMLAQHSSSWLFDNDAALRALMAAAQGHIGGDAAVPVLMDLMKDKDNQVRRSAGTALQTVAPRLSPAQVETLIAMYESEGDVPARFNLLRSLGAARSERTRSFLLKEFNEATTLVRPHAALALAIDGHPDNAAPLLAALDDQHELSGRSALVLSLGLIGNPEAVDPVLAILERAREPALQGYASLAAGLLAPDRAQLVDRLRDLVGSSTDVELTRLATISLGLIGERGALNDIIESASGSLGSLDKAARLHAVGWVGDRNQLDPLIAIIEDDRHTSYVKTYALQALGEICDPRDVPPESRLSAFVELNHDVGFLFELYTLQ